jgi:hypothetical protein
VQTHFHSFRNAGLAFVAAITSLAACGDGSTPSTTTGAVTFWQDVAPIYNEKCVRCHQEGGIGPFRLDDYAIAKENAPTEAAMVKADLMPPYQMRHDGTCGSFNDDVTLTHAQKATIEAWVKGGALEGTKVTLTPAKLPVLEGATDLKTPMFAPTPQGGDLAADDEYRCFLMDPPNAADAFLTGYDVTPGEPAIVHHVLMFVVDPAKNGKGTQSTRTNAEIMKALDDASPDRLGWPCFGAAGDGVNVTAVPVTWAPGQGVVSYPSGMGVRVRPADKLVVQMHYNMADLGNLGKMDSTAVHLRFQDQVSRQLVFALPDPLLESLQTGMPDTLPAGLASTSYKWMRTGAELGLGGVPFVDLVAIMPHMHARGLRQLTRIGEPNMMSCAAHLEPWDFHWQQFYFYEAPIRMTSTTQLEVTCDFDTANAQGPVLPGWGTRNEMCLTVLMLALPPM